jgi:hypothetical protein
VDPLNSGMNDARELSKTHYQITLARTRVWHRLRSQYFFALYFPGIERFIRSSQVDRLAEFLAPRFAPNHLWTSGQMTDTD